MSFASSQRKLKLEIERLREELFQAEEELADRQAEIFSFEARVQKRIGTLLSRVQALDNEIQLLEREISELRNQQIFGKNHGFQEPDYWRNWEHISQDEPLVAPQILDPEDVDRLKTLYRQLARHFHPDLAADEEDRAYRTEAMTAINQAYTTRNLEKLQALRMELVFSTGPIQEAQQTDLADEYARLQDDVNHLQKKLAEKRSALQALKFHPTVQLSLEFKLAQSQGRNLLAEMARNLRADISKKTAQRDFLLSQLKASDG